MPEAFAIYEALPIAAQQEILDFIYFIAAKIKNESCVNDYDDDISKRMAILASLEKFRGRLPKNFDADKELAEAREEKYLR